MRSLEHPITKGEVCRKGGKPGKAVESGDGKNFIEVPLKRRIDEHDPEQKINKMKRRNQAIYAAVDDDDAS